MSRENVHVLREALAWLADTRDLYGNVTVSEEIVTPIVAAAAAYAEGRSVDYCEMHKQLRVEGYAHCPGVVALSVPCRMVRVRVVPYNEEG